MAGVADADERPGAGDGDWLGALGWVVRGGPPVVGERPGVVEVGCGVAGWFAPAGAGVGRTKT